MHIEQARKLITGDRVILPKDGLLPRRTGKVTQWNKDLTFCNELISVQGQRYIWISVKDLFGTANWPSSRLERIGS